MYGSFQQSNTNTIGFSVFLLLSVCRQVPIVVAVLVLCLAGICCHAFLLGKPTYFREACILWCEACQDPDTDDEDDYLSHARARQAEDALEELCAFHSQAVLASRRPSRNRNRRLRSPPAYKVPSPVHPIILTPPPAYSVEVSAPPIEPSSCIVDESQFQKPEAEVCWTQILCVNRLHNFSILFRTRPQ